MVKFGL